MRRTALKILAGVMHNKHWKKTKIEDRLGDGKIIRWWMIRSNTHCDHHWWWKMKMYLKHILKKSGRIILCWKRLYIAFSWVWLKKNSHIRSTVSETPIMMKENNAIVKLYPRMKLTHGLSWKLTVKSIVTSVWKIRERGPLL